MKRIKSYILLIVLLAGTHVTIGQSLFDKPYILSLLQDTATIHLRKLDKSFVEMFNKINYGKKRISIRKRSQMEYYVSGKKRTDSITLILKNDNKYLILVSKKKWKGAPKYLICAEVVAGKITDQATLLIYAKYVNNKTALWYCLQNNEDKP